MLAKCNSAVALGAGQQYAAISDLRAGHLVNAGAPAMYPLGSWRTGKKTEVVAIPAGDDLSASGYRIYIFRFDKQA